EPLVGAGPLAAGDVADVDDEGEILAVHLLDHRVQRRRLGLVVGRIADQRERETVADGGGQRPGNVRGAACEREQQYEEKPFHNRFSLYSNSSASRGESSSGLAASSASRRASGSSGGPGSLLPRTKRLDCPPRVRLASSSICRYLRALRTT